MTIPLKAPSPLTATPTRTALDKATPDNAAPTRTALDEAVHRAAAPTRTADPRTALDEAVHRAVRRDLRRLAAALAGPVTTVRRAALVAHIEFLVPRLLAHHAGEDRRWNRATERHPGLAPHAATARAGHRAVRRAGQDVLSAGRTWAVDGDLDARTDLHHRITALADLAIDQFRHDERDRPLLADALTPAAAAGPDETPRAPGRRPALVAHDLLWLVDELDPALAGPLVGRHSRPARWALRNLFSGGYNRSAHLMWRGGGDGPAI